jgi:hypothetical protein
MPTNGRSGQNPADDELCHAYCSIMQPKDGMATFAELDALAGKLDGMAAAGTPCVLQRPQGSTSEAVTPLVTVGSGDDAKEVRIWFNNLPGMEAVYKATYSCADIAEVVRNGLKGGCGDYSAANGAPGLVYGE